MDDTKKRATEALKQFLADKERLATLLCSNYEQLAKDQQRGKWEPKRGPMLLTPTGIGGWDTDILSRDFYGIGKKAICTDAASPAISSMAAVRSSANFSVRCNARRKWHIG